MLCFGIAGEQVTLKSSDEESFEVLEEVANMSETIRNMIEGKFPRLPRDRQASDFKTVHRFLLLLCHADTGAEAPIPLPNVTGKVLSKVIEYCQAKVQSKKANGVPAKTEEENKAWESEFVKLDQGTLFQLILVGRVPSCERNPSLKANPLRLTGRELLEHQGAPRSDLLHGRQHD